MECVRGTLVAAALLWLCGCANVIDSPENREQDARLASADSTVAAVIITDMPAESIQQDPFRLDSVSISGDTLLLRLSYSGGCQPHAFQLYMTPSAFLESFPVQADLFVRHQGHGDACEAYLSRELGFDLRPIAELYRRLYGSRGEILLNVFDFFEGTPGEHLQVRYLLK
ncbi:MAG: hypothetical protein D6743_04005 [Calditrichaeota bacterium]|nr:MAG: hypothetical protein D6743_04005 [Calditrichota bacterium]